MVREVRVRAQEWWDKPDVQAARAQQINAQIAARQRAMGLSGRPWTSIDELIRDADALAAGSGGAAARGQPTSMHA